MWYWVLYRKGGGAKLLTGAANHARSLSISMNHAISNTSVTLIRLVAMVRRVTECDSNGKHKSGRKEGGVEAVGADRNRPNFSRESPFAINVH